jgi:hypothetical protein
VKFLERISMSDRSQFRNGHYATLHAFLLAAKRKGLTEFRLQLSTNANGTLEFAIHPTAKPAMSRSFDVRGNVIRPVTPVTKALAQSRGEDILPLLDGGPAL